MSSASPAIPRRPETGASTSTSDSSPAGTASRSVPAPWPWPGSSSAGTPTLITANWWKEERGERVFVDFNQNAPHKTVFGAWFARPRVGGQVSTPLAWDEIETVDPEALTIRTVPDLVRRRGDPWAGIAERPQSLQPLLDMAARDRADGLHDAPWPPEYPKQPDEPPRVAPSRAKKGLTGGPVDALRRIAYLLERDGAESYKVRAFRNAAAAIADVPDDELAAMSSARLQKIPGVGKTSAQVIAEAARRRDAGLPREARSRSTRRP